MEWFLWDKVDITDSDLDSIKITMIKLIQMGISEGLLSGAKDISDIFIAKKVNLRYDKQRGRLIFDIDSPWREEIYDLLKK
jgi:hypothetical protein